MRLLAVICTTALLACDPSPSPSTSDAGTPPIPTPWRLVRSDLTKPLLSAWMSPDGVLYAVGGSREGSLVVRHDRNGWWTMDPGTAEPLWWVTAFAANDVIAVGEHGTITTFDGERWNLRRSGGDATLYGVWGESSKEFWAVGGVAATLPGSPMAVRLHRGRLTEELAGLPPTRALFKVWGTGSLVRVVGDEGLAARWDEAGGAWSVDTTGTTQRLVTIFGRDAENVYAVGGTAHPLLLRARGPVWSDISPRGVTQPLLGGAMSWPGAASSLPDLVVSGWGGAIGELGDKGFVARAPVSPDDLHAVTPIPNGFVAVGGDILGDQKRGAIVARGTLAGGEFQAWPNASADLRDAGLEYDAGDEDAGFDAGFDAGEDAGDDAGPDASVDAGTPIPHGGDCSSDFNNCEPGYQCWGFAYVSPQQFICSRSCASATDCGAFGADACCNVPGPQVSQPVCQAVGTGTCAPDAGP